MTANTERREKLENILVDSVCVDVRYWVKTSDNDSLRQFIYDALGFEKCDEEELESQVRGLGLMESEEI